MSDYETRVGEFNRSFGGLRAESAYKAIERGFHHGGNDELWVDSTTIENSVEGSEISDQGVEVFTHNICRLMQHKMPGSQNYEGDFRDITGALGYEIGRNLDQDTQAEDLENLSETIYNSINLETNGVTGFALDKLADRTGGFLGRQQTIYGHGRDEITAHLQDSMWIGYMESE